MMNSSLEKTHISDLNKSFIWKETKNWINIRRGVTNVRKRRLRNDSLFFVEKPM